MTLKSIRKIFLLLTFATIALSMTGCGCFGPPEEVEPLPVFYRDADSDGYGDPANSMEAETQPKGYVVDNTDCDDTNPYIHPGAKDICDDGIDQDCDGMYKKNCAGEAKKPPLRTFYRDADGDGYGNPRESKRLEMMPRGYVVDKTDCNDTDSSIHPGAKEFCGDNIDQDCDELDEACPQINRGNNDRGGAEEPPPAPEKLDTVYFDYDKSLIRSDAEETLVDNASWLKREQNKDYKINIVGHCDERGTTEYNAALGERRAESSKKFLINLGIDAGRLETKSLGEEVPAKEGHDESAWKWNRRSEFEVIGK